MIRLSLAIILLLLSLLVLFRAPTNFFWKVAVAVTEFPWVFMLTAILLFTSCFWMDKYKLISIIVSGISFLLFSYPVIKAFKVAGELQMSSGKIVEGSSAPGQLKSPFSFFKMFSGIVDKKIIPERFIYKKVKERNFVIDFYSNGEKKKSPCIIVIHGGSWSGGDEKQLADLNSYLALQGYRVAAISYRLAPEFKSPAPVEDTKDAMQYLIANSEKLNIDTNNFILLGRSAGGQIALVAAYSFHDPKIRGVISFYAPADMVWGAKITGNPLVLDTKKVFADYLGGSYDEFPQKYHESSSCEYVDAVSPPTLIIHGEIDPMVAFHHAELLREKLNANRIRNYFIDLPCGTHGCDYNINGPSGQITTFAVERFIADVTRK